MTPFYLNNRKLINRKSGQSRGQNIHRILEKESSQRMQSQTTRSQPVSSRKKISKKGKPPISIIIGVIVIAVILMIAIFIRVIFFPEGFIRKDPTPSIVLNWNEDHENQGHYTGLVESTSNIINIDNITVRVSHGSYTGSIGLDYLAGGGLRSSGTFTIGFSDLPPTGQLGHEDIFTIIGGNSGDTIRLIYKPTGGQMCSSTLH